MSRRILKRAPDLSFVNGSVLSVQNTPEFHTVFTAPFELTLDEFEARLVYNSRRRALFTSFKIYVQATRALRTPPIIQVVGGSFVDEVDEPGDIDLINIIDRDIAPDAMGLYYDRTFIRETFGLDVSTIALTGDKTRDCLMIMRAAVYGSHRRDDTQRAIFMLRQG